MPGTRALGKDEGKGVETLKSNDLILISEVGRTVSYLFYK
jgi:hypothetical protein